MWCIQLYTVNSQKGENAEKGYWYSGINFTNSCDGLEKNFPQAPLQPLYSQGKSCCRYRKCQGWNIIST